MKNSVALRESDITWFHQKYITYRFEIINHSSFLQGTSTKMMMKKMKHMSTKRKVFYFYQHFAHVFSKVYHLLLLCLHRYFSSSMVKLYFKLCVLSKYSDIFNSNFFMFQTTYAQQEGCWKRLHMLLQKWHCNSLSTKCFPFSDDLNEFMTRVNRHLLSLIITANQLSYMLFTFFFFFFLELHAM